jgi:hypothetical protein
MIPVEAFGLTSSCYFNVVGAVVIYMPASGRCVKRR